MTVTVREADLMVDGDKVVAMIDAYSRDPTASGAPLPGDVRERLIPGLQSHAGTLVLLAMHAQEPVGIAVCFFGFSTFAAKPLLNVHDLAVIPGYRGRGVSRMLLESAEAIARARDCCKLTLEVFAKNERARSVYQRFGFADYQLDPSMGSALFMEKKL
jgi:GNAT superfamily N-acetyltransferase